MTELNNMELFEEFYDMIKEDISIDFEDLKDVLFGPWRYLKSEMESGELDTIRFKYFGIFTVFPGRVNMSLAKTQKNFEEGKINKVKYNNYMTVLNNYKKKHEKA